MDAKLLKTHRMRHNRPILKPKEDTHITLFLLKCLPMSDDL